MYRLYIFTVNVTLHSTMHLTVQADQEAFHAANSKLISEVRTLLEEERDIMQLMLKTALSTQRVISAAALDSLTV